MREVCPKYHDYPKDGTKHHNLEIEPEFTHAYGRLSMQKMQFRDTHLPNLYWRAKNFLNVYLSMLLIPSF